MYWIKHLLYISAKICAMIHGMCLTLRTWTAPQKVTSGKCHTRVWITRLISYTETMCISYTYIKNVHNCNCWICLYKCLYLLPDRNTALKDLLNQCTTVNSLRPLQGASPRSCLVSTHRELWPSADWVGYIHTDHSWPVRYFYGMTQCEVCLHAVFGRESCIWHGPIPGYGRKLYKESTMCKSPLKRKCETPYRRDLRKKMNMHTYTRDDQETSA